MPIPESWPRHVQERAKTFLALLKYYRFSRTLGEAAVPFLMAREAGQVLDKNDTLRGIAFLNYWIASLYVLSEGWRELGLRDAAIDPLLTDAHVKVLRRYRNTVFHFQADLEDPRMGAMAASADAIGWVISLGTAFQDFFRHHDREIDIERIQTWLFDSAAD